MDMKDEVFRILKKELNDAEEFGDKRIEILGLMVDLATNQDAKVYVAKETDDGR